MKRKAVLDSDDKSPEAKKVKKVFTASDFITLLSDSSSAFVALANFIKSAEAHLEDRTEDDVVQSYCKSTSDCKEILDLLTEEKPKTPEIYQVLESIRLILVRIFSDLKQYEIIGQSVAKKLVTNHVPEILRLTSIGNKSHQIKSALRLLTLLTSGICSSKWGWISKEVLSKIDFSHANWTALVNRKDGKDPEDVKFCLTEFICNLMSSRNLSVLKTLAEAKSFIPTLFECLHGDNSVVICRILTVVLVSIVNNTSLTKTFKIRLFNEKSLKALCRLYNWTGAKSWQEMAGPKKDKNKSKKSAEEKPSSFDLDNMSEEQVSVRSHVHKLLVQLCSSFRNGIIFKDKSAPIISGQNPNHVITNLLQNLPQSFYKDPLMCNLAAEIFSSCPDQIHFFLGASSFAGCLVPRVSRNWFSCSEFVTQVFQGQVFTPRTFPLFLLSGDPQKMGENYVRHVLPPAEIWKKLLDGLLEQHEDQVMARCLNFLNINAERLLKAKQLIRQERISCSDLFENSKHFYHEFEAAFHEGLRKNLPTFAQMVQRMERFVSKEKKDDDDEESEDKKKAKELILQELPAINQSEVIGQFLQVMCNLTSLGVDDDEANRVSTSVDRIIATVETVLSSSSTKEDTQNLKRRSKGAIVSDDGSVQISSESSGMHIKELLLHFWQTILLRRIPLEKFVQDSDLERNLILKTSLELLLNDDGTDDADLSRVMLLDALSQVLLESGAFASIDEIRSWLRNLRPADEENPKKYTKKCTKFFLSSLASSLGKSDKAGKDADLSLFLRTSLEQAQGDTFIDSYVDKCVFDIVATSTDPVQTSSQLHSHKVIKNGGLSKSKLVIDFLASEKLKKKSKCSMFEIDSLEKLTTSDVRSLQYHIKMICFASSVEAFKLSKIDSSKSDEMAKLNNYLEKLSTSIRELNTMRIDNCSEGKDDEADVEEDDNVATRKNPVLEHSRKAEICKSIFEETCTQVFSSSFLQTFFLSHSSASVVINDWFALMAEKLPQVLDQKTLEVVLSVPVKKVQVLVSELLEGKESNVTRNQLTKLVKSFLLLLPDEMVKRFCTGFILNAPQEDSSDEHDVKILTESGRKTLSRRNALEHEDLFIETTKYLKERIMKTRLSDESLRCSFDFILDFIKMKPSQGLELLNSNKKKKSFFYHLVSSSQKIKLNFIEDLMKIIPRENQQFLSELSTWLEVNKEVWSSEENWMNYLGILMEFVRCSKASDRTRNVGHSLWMHAVRLMCSAGDPSSGKMELIKSVFEAMENLFEMFSDKIASDDIVTKTSEHWSKFVKVGLKHHLMNKSFINTLSSVIYRFVVDADSPSIPPLSLHPSIPDVFNMVLGHSMFLKVITLETNSPEKESIFKLLHTMASAVPDKCCTANLVPMLFGAFSATLSTTDKCILSLLRMSEEKGADVLQHKPYYWGQKAVDYQASKKVLFANVLNHGLNELLDQVDPKMMMDAALNFPFSGKLDCSTYSPFNKENTYSTEDKEPHKYYNPYFFLPIFYHLMDKSVDCRKFVERNCLGLAIASLTSHEASVRSLGATILSTFRGHLEESKFIDKQQVMCLLDALKNGMEGNGFKLSSIVSVFLIRASSILLKPDHHMYVLVNQFLLIKPAIDLHNVPEFYKLFFSSSMEHKKERIWFLEMLADGLRETKDYHICEKRRLFKCIMTFYNSPLCDQANKVLILNILLNMCFNSRSVVWNLIKKHGFLSWMAAAFFAFSGNLNKKWTSTTSHQSSSFPASLQVINEKLVQLLQACWKAVHSGRNISDKMEQDSDENQVLSPTVLAEFLLTFEHLIESSLCFSSTLRSTLAEMRNSAMKEAAKTEIIFKNKGFIFPLPVEH